MKRLLLPLYTLLKAYCEPKKEYTLDEIMPEPKTAPPLPQEEKRSVERSLSLEEEADVNMRELLRENLKTVRLDIFDLTDPHLSLSDEERKKMEFFFFKLQMNKDFRYLRERIEHLVNKQMHQTLSLGQAGSTVFDRAGAMNVNGLCLVLDMIKNYSNHYIKTHGAPPPRKPTTRV